VTWDFDRHVEVFNRAVTSREWEEFVGLFTEDATMEFHGPPVGPLTGRDQIAAAYQSSPPEDTIELTGAPGSDGDEDEDVVPFRWRREGTTGRLRARTDGTRLTRLVVVFDGADDADHDQTTEENR
jgi:hypothetical protein